MWSSQLARDRNVHLLFYRSPVDHHILDEWPQLAASWQRRIASRKLHHRIEIGTTPLLSYRQHACDLLGLAPLRLGGKDPAVRIELWCAIVFYSVILVALSPEVDPGSVKAALAGEKLLKEHRGWFGPDEADMVAISSDLTMVQSLARHIRNRLYLGERDMVENQMLNGDYTCHDDFCQKIGTGVVTFTSGAPADEANIQCVAEGISNEGLAIMNPGDPAVARVGERFHDLDDLTVILPRPPGSPPVITLGRCHMDDSYMCIYGLGNAGLELQEIEFFL